MNGVEGTTIPSEGFALVTRYPFESELVFSLTYDSGLPANSGYTVQGHVGPSNVDQSHFIK